MKLLLLADINSTHTKRWVRSLSEKGIDICVFGFSPAKDDFYQNINVKLFSSKSSKSSDTILSKFSYLFLLRKLKRVYKDFQPDIVHAHYASSYGLLGRLLKKSPFILSVWGSDVYDFPNRNIFFKNILVKNLKKADQICSTSKCMAKETKKYFDTDIKVIPFGVNTRVLKSKERNIDNKKFIIGTVKTLSDIYGIDILIRAFKVFSDNNTNVDAELHVYGDGPEHDKYDLLCEELDINNKVIFKGRIENEKINDALNTFDIFAALSRQESFGVVIVEAMSCKIPVVVSNIGGLSEIVDDNKTGLIVESENYNKAAKAFEKLYKDRNLRNSLAENARKKVEKEYKWDENVDSMIALYKELEKKV